MTKEPAQEVDSASPLQANPVVDSKVLIDAAVDAWKTTVSVQQHFNDIEMRIRNFAITFAAAVLGLAGLALKEDAESLLPAALLSVGVMAWGAFYFMDRFWYHRFLDAATEHARRVEGWLAAATGTGEHVFNLAGGIKAKSGIPLTKGEQSWGGRLVGTVLKDGRIHSHHRIDLFYAAFATGSAVLAFVFYQHARSPREKPPIGIVLRGVSGVDTLRAAPSLQTTPQAYPSNEQLSCSPDNRY